MQGIGIILLYVVIIGAFYLIAIRPQKKKEKQHQALVNAVAVGDSILTTLSLIHISTSYTVHKDSFGYLFSGSFGAVFNILLNFILVPVIGVYGAALATCCLLYTSEK